MKKLLPHSIIRFLSLVFLLLFTAHLISEIAVKIKENNIKKEVVDMEEDDVDEKDTDEQEEDYLDTYHSIHFLLGIEQHKFTLQKLQEQNRFSSGFLTLFSPPPEFLNYLS